MYLYSVTLLFTNFNFDTIMVAFDKDDSKISQYAFCIGVCNLVFSTWLMSVYPWNYFIWHSIKNIFLLYFRYITWKKKKWSLFLFDFCYIVNYTSFIYFTICIVKAQLVVLLLSSSFKMNLSISNNYYYGPILFRIFFSWSTGVLAMAIAMFRNSLVFHSFDHMCILAIHIGPPLVTYGFRWYIKQLEYDWPNTFHIDCNNSSSSIDDINSYTCKGDWIQLIILPFIAYIIVWSIPYSILMFIYLDRNIKSEGWVTMYSFYESSLFPSGWDRSSPLPSTINDRLKPFLYMSLHALLCLLSFVLSYFMWHSFWLHTLYLLTLLLISIFNGATYYFKVMKKQIIKQYEEQKRTKKNDDDKIVANETY